MEFWPSYIYLPLKNNTKRNIYMRDKLSSLLRSGPGIILILLLITNFLNGGLKDPKTYFFNMLLTLPGIVVGLSFHEFAHAFASNAFGDPTPKAQGRLTINPAKHIDPFGFFALIFCGFGWGVPVQIDNRYYKRPRLDEFIVSVAGVTMNLIIAIVFAFISRFAINLWGRDVILTDSVQGLAIKILLYVVMINITLMIFNLIPVPPLDGFGLVTELFNLRKTGWYYTVYQYGGLVLLLLLLFGVVSRILYPLTSSVYSMLLTGIILA